MVVLLILTLASLAYSEHAAPGCSEASRASNLLQKSVVHKQVMWLSGVALASPCNSESYLDQYEAALLSWKETNNSAFDPHLLVHRPSNLAEPLPELIQKRLDRFQEMGVHVIFHRLSFIDVLKRNLHKMRLADDLQPDCAAASFLRLELPRILSEKNLLQPWHHQKYVLWTDCDILWWRTVPISEFLSNVPVKEFSMAFSGQIVKEQRPINDGVMLMDLKNYQQDMPKLLASIDHSEQNSGLDQAVVHRFYEKHPGLSGWSVIWNYRMFWNGRDPVAILHFWGLKPSDGLDCWMQQRSLVGCPAIEKGLIPSDRRAEFQTQAFDMAMRQDPQLVFMKQAMERYKKLRAMVGGSPLES